MRRNVLRRGLTWCVVALLLLPIVLVVVLGLGGLLAALGDGAAAAVCSRVALGLGVLLVVAIVATTAVNSLALLTAPGRPRRGRRRRRMERRTVVERPLGGP